MVWLPDDEKSLMIRFDRILACDRQTNMTDEHVSTAQSRDYIDRLRPIISGTVRAMHSIARR